MLSGNDREPEARVHCLALGVCPMNSSCCFYCHPCGRSRPSVPPRGTCLDTHSPGGGPRSHFSAPAHVTSPCARVTEHARPCRLLCIWTHYSLTRHRESFPHDPCTHSPCSLIPPPKLACSPPRAATLPRPCKPRAPPGPAPASEVEALSPRPICEQREGKDEAAFAFVPPTPGPGPGQEQN